MKILHLIQRKQLRGAEIFTSQLASHINRSGHTAMIASVFPGSASLPFDGEIISLNGKPSKRFWDVKAWSKLAHLIASEKPDIVQANAGDTLKYAVFSKIFFGWKQPILFRNASTISLYIKSGFARRLNGFFFRHVTRIISVSKTSANDFSTLFPAYKRRILTIPIGIEQWPADEAPQPPLPGSEIKNTNFSTPYLVHVGGFSFEKNHEGLINIFELVLQSAPGAILHLVGDGPLRKKVEEIVSSRGLTGKVVFHGFKKNALEYIQKADVLLLPSLIEGLPGVILEAFYCKTPVVAYNVGGIPEILIDSITGQLIKKDDELAFANAVVSTLSGSYDSKQQTINAYRLVIEGYMNTQVARQFLSLYKSLLAVSHQ